MIEADPVRARSTDNKMRKITPACGGIFFYLYFLITFDDEDSLHLASK